MSGKRNHEWTQATAWDGYFTQDKAGGVTERVDPGTVMARLLSEGFLQQGLDFLTFDTTPENAITQVGAVSWNADEGTLDIQQPGGVTLQVGQETQIHVVNKSGTSIPNGAVVYLTGAQGNRPTVALAEADVLDHSHAIAVATQTLDNNAEGFVTLLGLVRELNTSAFAEGAALYLSDTPGGLTATAPTSRVVRIGFVVRSHATVGAILVAIERGANLDDLGDVTATNPTDGQVLTYSTTLGKWVAATPTGGGGSGTSTAKYASTMPPALAVTKLGPPNGQSTNWAYHGTLLVPTDDVVLTVGTTKLAMQWPQPAQGASYFFAVYRWVAAGSPMVLVCSTAVAVMPGSNSWLDLPVAVVQENLAAGAKYYFCVFWAGNGGMAMGTQGDNLNVQPYQACWDMNQGALTGPPATLAITGEDYRRFFGRVLAS